MPDKDEKVPPAAIEEIKKVEMTITYSSGEERTQEIIPEEMMAHRVWVNPKETDTSASRRLGEALENYEQKATELYQKHGDVSLLVASSGDEEE